MQIIEVCKFLETTSLLAPDKGRALKNLIESLISKGKIVLDFKGYEYISSSFLNESLGKILIEKTWSINDFKANIEIVNIDEDDGIDIELSLENAKNKLRLIQKNIDPEKFYRENIPAV